MKSDIEIAHSIKLQPIETIARKAGIPTESLEQYGKYIAKVPYTLIDDNRVRRSNLILVTAITPTKAGIGKTTVSIGLALGLNRLGYKAIAALREPSMGPCFGMKGGAAGGGYAQVLPMEKINLHFTGDFHAITEANNMISALFDNYRFRHEAEGFALRKLLWRRVMDVNDRGLRNIVTGLGGHANGRTTESGFDITPASEIMAILCLANSEDDLKRRIDRIMLGETLDKSIFTMRDLGMSGSITAILHDAINPNLVQTTEGTPAFIHGGPFANIAHGCNSVLATKLAMTYGDYAITEAGFGADLGAEKFLDIKCRTAGISPKLSVLVVTTQALKLHGGAAQADISKPDAEALLRGMANMDRHIDNLKKFGQSVVVCLNRYAFDTDDELELVRQRCEQKGVEFAINNAFSEGGKGAEELARKVVETIAKKPSEPLRYMYQLDDDPEEKIRKVCKQVYGASNIVLRPSARKLLDRIRTMPELCHMPVCIAKTQYSFSDDAKLLGAPSGFDITIRDLVVNAGAGMIVAIAGEIMRMPGLPVHPAAEHIDVVNGEIVGLS